MKTKTVLFALLLLSVTVSAKLKVSNLLTGNLVNPLGIDSQQLRFSWQLESEEKGVLQTGYLISIEYLGRQIWSSKKVSSSQSVMVPYTGMSLKSGERYTWSVKVWDNMGRRAGAKGASFRMGLHASDWSAKWIQPGYKEDSILRPSPVFLKDFTLKKKITSAVLYASGHGMYEVSLNGKRVSDAFFTPGWTSYAKRLQYQCFDVTDLIEHGANHVQVMMGSGWYRGYIGFDSHPNFYGDDISLLFQLELRYSDGTGEKIISDDSWKSTTGMVRSSEIYHGEIQDARLSPGKPSGVKPANFGFANLVSSSSPYVKTQERIPPVKIFFSPKGEQIVDFGQNLVGFVRLKVRGNTGDSIVLDHAEVIDKVGNFYNQNLRTARAQNVFVLKGGGEELFEPHFSWQGFRYVRISGVKNLQKENLQAIVLHSDLSRSGHFECSNPLINKLYQNVLWSQKGNFLELPTDCPQRDERLGWLADAQLFSTTAAYNYNVHTFFAKWLKDLSLDQFPDGNVPVVIPDVVPGLAGAAAWSDAATILPWNMYQIYGDRQILENQYQSMKKWLDYQQKKSKNFLRLPAFQFGDWLSYTVNGPSDPNRSAVSDMEMLAQLWYIRSCSLVVKTANVLNYTQDAQLYGALLENLKSAFLKEYVTPGGRMVSSTQTAYVLALAFDVLPEQDRAAAAKRLVDNIRSYDNHITTGLMGTSLICPVLCRFGYANVAYDLLLQESYPSWLYPVKMGATTIWERWDGIKSDGTFQNPTMNSFNQYALGAIGEWLYSDVLGISPLEPGYKKIQIKPHLGGKLSFCKGSYLTYYGNVGVDWKVKDGKFVLDVIVPANTTAEVWLPSSSKGKTIGSGAYHFEEEI